MCSARNTRCASGSTSTGVNAKLLSLSVSTQMRIAYCVPNPCTLPPPLMRIWVDTDKLNSFALTPVDVTTAIQNQNVQVAGGQLGGTPAPPTQRLTATITEATLLRTPEEFGNILLKVNTNGSQVRVRDVASIGLG